MRIREDAEDGDESHDRTYPSRPRAGASRPCRQRPAARTRWAA